MKTMFNKRRFLAVLSAALLISTALVTSCMNPQNEYQGGQDDQYVPPTGKGLIRIRVNGSDARTILPDLPEVEDLYYRVVFIGTDSDNNVSFPDDFDAILTNAGSFDDLNGIPIALEPDDYTITITAWDDEDCTKALAGWEENDVTIEDGETTVIVANLKGFTSGGMGIFAYNVTVPDLPSGWLLTTPPSAYNTATMEISGQAAINLSKGSNSDEVDLSSGYYTVTIRLSADNCQDRVATYVMHIYSNMTSTLNDSLPPVNQNKFSVAFSLNGYNNDDGGIINLTTIPNIENAGLVTDPGSPKNTTHDFGGWYPSGSNDGTVSGTQWNFTTSKVFRDTTLYAKWTEKAPDPVTIFTIEGVTPPVAGATPVTAITETAQYTGSVEWDNGNPGIFAAATVYTATITLTPASGYTLTGVTANFFQVSGATSVSNAANSGIITAVFPATNTTITLLTIPGVTAPVAGATPVTTPITATPQYIGTISWVGSPAIFAAGTPYTATITLEPSLGFTFYGVGANAFTVAGVSATNAANDGVVTVTFPNTAATITDPAAIPGVTLPVTGVAPVRNLDATQYTGTISWSPPVANGETFAAETVYTATIILTPKTGYTLYGIAANFFTVAGATSVTSNTAGNGVVSAIFPETDPAASGINITLTFVLPTDASISGPAGPVSYNDIADGTTSLTFTLGGGDFDDVTWNLDGVSLGSGSSVTINSSTPNLASLLVDGPHRLNASGTRDDESWGAFVQFVINN